MTLKSFILFRGRFLLDLLTPLSTPDVGRRVFQYDPGCNLGAVVQFVG